MVARGIDSLRAPWATPPDSPTRPNCRVRLYECGCCSYAIVPILVPRNYHLGWVRTNPTVPCDGVAVMNLLVVPPCPSHRQALDPSFPIKREDDLSPRHPARRRNAAISPRVTGEFGQNRSLTWGLHPLVIPPVARRSIASSNIEASSTTKGSVPAPLEYP